jgi:hypothetical protein
MDDWATAPLPATENLGLRKPNVKNVTVTPLGFSSFATAEIQ